MPRYVTKSEYVRKRAWFRAINGLTDFFGSIASFIIILLCVALLSSLISWLRSDLPTTLNAIESFAVNAIVNPEQPTS